MPEAALRRVRIIFAFANRIPAGPNSLASIPNELHRPSIRSFNTFLVVFGKAIFKRSVDG